MPESSTPDSVSCAVLRTPLDAARQSQHLTLVLGVRLIYVSFSRANIVKQLLAAEVSDPEAAYRTLVALGNVVCVTQLLLISVIRLTHNTGIWG